MALKGTLKDFGIADILQLIGQQLKTGVLNLSNKDQDVQVFFVNGNVTKAASASRDRQDLLGSILVRAEAISQEQLDTALEIQRRTLKRLGDILVDSGYVTRDEVRDFTRLQTTETLYQLFLWKNGNYEFVQQEVEQDPESYSPIRAESVLMEGFRMVDEWPFIRERITSYEMRFELLKTLEPAAETPAAEDSEEDFLSGIDDAFDALDGGEDKPEPEKDLGENEHKVFALISPDRDVQKIIDLSRLGEFETCKALLNLMNAGYLAGVAPKRRRSRSQKSDAGGGLMLRRGVGWIFPVLARVAMSAILLALVLVLLRISGVDPSGIWQSNDLIVRQARVQEALGWRAMQRIKNALQVYRLEHGKYPASLELLVQEQFLHAYELRFPWQQAYAYRLTAKGYELLRPFR